MQLLDRLSAAFQLLYVELKLRLLANCLGMKTVWASEPCYEYPQALSQYRERSLRVFHDWFAQILYSLEISYTILNDRVCWRSLGNIDNDLLIVVHNVVEVAKALTDAKLVNRPMCLFGLREFPDNRWEHRFGRRDCPSAPHVILTSAERWNVHPLGWTRSSGLDQHALYHPLLVQAYLFGLLNECRCSPMWRLCMEMLQSMFDNNASLSRSECIADIALPYREMYAHAANMTCDGLRILYRRSDIRRFRMIQAVEGRSLTGLESDILIDINTQESDRMASRINRSDSMTEPIRGLQAFDDESWRWSVEYGGAGGAHSIPDWVDEELNTEGLSWRVRDGWDGLYWVRVSGRSRSRAYI